MSTADVNYLVWLDLETTGLTGDDMVLEVCAHITMADLSPIDPTNATFNYVYNLRSRRNVGLWEPAVVEMHTTNGLIVECVKSDCHYSDKGVDTALVEWLWRALDCAPVPGSFMLAGAGVSHFDHELVKRVYPEFSRYLHYATIDVSVIERFGQLCGVMTEPTSVPEGRKLHRAEPDVQDALNLARWFQGNLSWPCGPTWMDAP